MNTSLQASDRKHLIWPAMGILIGVMARTNPFYHPHIPLEVVNGVKQYLGLFLF
jgi:hypothetical protein